MIFFILKMENNIWVCIGSINKLSPKLNTFKEGKACSNKIPGSNKVLVLSAVEVSNGLWYSICKLKSCWSLAEVCTLLCAFKLIILYSCSGSSLLRANFKPAGNYWYWQQGGWTWILVVPAKPQGSLTASELLWKCACQEVKITWLLVCLVWLFK